MGKILTVKPALELPHVLMFKGESFTFDPSCEVPDELAQALLRYQGHNFVALESGEKPDMKAYRWKDAFKNKSIAEIVATLSDASKVKVYNLAKKLAVEEARKVPEPAASAGSTTPPPAA